jgi:hypothetical protein
MGPGAPQRSSEKTSEASAAGKIMMTKPRLATRADEADLLALCKELHTENGLFSMDDDMVKEMLDRAFEKRGGIIGVIDDGGKIAACLYMLISNFWYSREHHLEELFSYVRPAFRKTPYASSLLTFAQDCSKTLAIPLVIGVLTNSRMEAKVKLYSRKFGRPAGAFFVVGGTWHNDSVASEELWRTHTRGGKRRSTSNELLVESMTTTAALPLMPLTAVN